MRPAALAHKADCAPLLDGLQAVLLSEIENNY